MGRCEAPVDDAELGLVVAEAELGIGQPPVGSGSLEVGPRVQEAGVPVPGGAQRLMVAKPVVRWRSWLVLSVGVFAQLSR